MKVYSGYTAQDKTYLVVLDNVTWVASFTLSDENRTVLKFRFEPEYELSIDIKPEDEVRILADIYRCMVE